MDASREGDGGRPTEGRHPRSARRCSAAALRKLGFDVSAARVGRVIDLELEAEDKDGAHEAIERMCADLLANPLIESFEIQIDDS